MPTLPATRPDRDRDAGFTLVELLLALSVLALIAGLALPYLTPNASRTAVRIKAMQVAALLRADRNAAERTGSAIVTTIDPGGRRVSAGSSAAIVALPETMTVKLANVGSSAVRFEPEGRSSGGQISIGGRGVQADVTVNTVTAAVAVDVR